MSIGKAVMQAVPVPCDNFFEGEVVGSVCDHFRCTLCVPGAWSRKKAAK